MRNVYKRDPSTAVVLITSGKRRERDGHWIKRVRKKVSNFFFSFAIQQQEERHCGGVQRASKLIRRRRGAMRMSGI
jgi:hypothetical protein